MTVTNGTPFLPDLLILQAFPPHLTHASSTFEQLIFPPSSKFSLAPPPGQQARESQPTWYILEYTHHKHYNKHFGSIPELYEWIHMRVCATLNFDIYSIFEYMPR